MAEATVSRINPITGKTERKKVTVGDPQAFAGGFEFEKKAPGSLAGTLTPTRTLPQDQDNGSMAFQIMLKKSLRELAIPKKSPIDRLRELSSTIGVDVQEAGLTAEALSVGQEESAATITERAKDAMSMLNDMENRKTKQREENMVFAKAFAEQLDWNITGEEWETLKLGLTTPELKTKAAGVPKKAATGSIAEYNLYKSEGGKGGFLDFVRVKEAAGRAPSGVGKQEDVKLKASSGFFDTKIESSFREDLVKLKEQQRADTTISDDSIFKTLRLLYSHQEVSDSAMNNTLGVKPIGIEDILLPGSFFDLDPFFGTSAISTPAFILKK